MLLGFGFFSFSIGNASFYILLDSDDNLKLKEVKAAVEELG